MTASSLPIPTAAPPAAPAAAVLCAHCNLPVPPGLLEPDASHQFCCQGCRSVYALLHECHLDRYYAYRAAADPGRPAAVSGKAFREYDDPAFLALHAPAAGGGLRTAEFYLESVHCAACVWLVEKLPGLVPGVLEARLDLGKALVRITFQDAAVRLSSIAQTLDRLGYTPHPARGASARHVRTLDDRRHLVRIGVAGACAGNAMLLALALYAGVLSSMESSFADLFRWLSMVLGLITLAWPGSVFFRGAWAAIKTRTPHLDLPIALALGAGGVAGLVNTTLGRGEIYFDSLTVLVFALLVGRFLQHRQQTRAADAVELLFSLTPMAARKVTPAGVQEVPISALQPGDVVEVLPGDSVPVDGTVVEGASAVDQSLLTGESRPQPLAAGMPACAGAVNLESPLRLTVTATGEATRVGKLMRLVAECARRQAPIMQLANRMAGYFLIAVIMLAAGTFAWWARRSPAAALGHAVALLIVACPCALGLATPLTMAVALGRAARRKIFIKGGEVLERLARAGTIYLDKTGTLTTGKTTLLAYHGPVWLKPLIGAVESQATHPVARAFCAAFEGDSAHRLAAPASGIQQQARGGICGEAEGRRLVIGSPGFIRSYGLTVPAELEVQIAGYLAQTLTPVLIACDNEVLAAAGFGDALRPEAAAAVAELRRRGWRVGILSGDHPEVVARVAAALDVPAEEARGGLLPEDKLGIVQEAVRHGPVVMVGDGVNDAAALAAATVGIAVHGGAEASLAAAHVFLNRPGLAAIAELLTASRQSLRTIRRGLAASLAYNLLAVSLAACGLINPLVAAVLMPLSSLTVLSLALAAPTFPREAP